MEEDLDYTLNYDDDYNYREGTLEEPCSRDDDNYLGAQLSVLFYFMFVFSLLGNGLVVVTIYRFERLTTVTNILLLNLVLSSLIFTSSLPFTAVYMQLSDWIFGNVMCKLTSSVYYLGFYSSVLFLTLLTFDRHLAIVYSLEALQLRTRRYAVVSCGMVWLVSGLACIGPMILHATYFHPIDNKTFCEELYEADWYLDLGQLRRSGFYIQLFLFLVFPLVVIIYCYIKIAITVISTKIPSKFKTVRLIFVIVVLFFMCWAPFNIVTLMYNSGAHMTCEEAQRLGYAIHATRTVAYIYFCISPIFYTFVGKKFQSYFMKMMVARFPSLKKESRNNVSTTFLENNREL